MRNDKNPKAEKDDPGPQVCLDSKNKFSMIVIFDIFSLGRHFFRNKCFFSLSEIHINIYSSKYFCIPFWPDTF